METYTPMYDTEKGRELLGSLFSGTCIPHLSPERVDQMITTIFEKAGLTQKEKQVIGMRTGLGYVDDDGQIVHLDSPSRYKDIVNAQKLSRTFLKMRESRAHRKLIDFVEDKIFEELESTE